MRERRSGSGIEKGSEHARAWEISENVRVRVRGRCKSVGVKAWGCARGGVSERMGEETERLAEKH